MLELVDQPVVYLLQSDPVLVQRLSQARFKLAEHGGLSMLLLLLLGSLIGRVRYPV